MVCRFSEFRIEIIKKKTIKKAKRRWKRMAGQISVLQQITEALRVPPVSLSIKVKPGNATREAR